jgi:hypothetical protein
MSHGGERACVGLGEGDKPLPGNFHLIAVTHPHDGFGRHSSEDAIRLMDLDHGSAKLTALARFHTPAHGLTCELHAVTDTENGNIEVKDGRVTLRRARVIDTGRPTGEDDPFGAKFCNALGRKIMTHDLTEDTLLAHTSGDELAKL